MKEDTDTALESQKRFKDNLESFLEKLAKAKMDFDSLAENISQGLARCEIICDEEGVPFDYRILSANKAYEKNTGIQKNLAIGKTILEIYPDIEKSWIETYGRVALTQQSEIITGYNHNTNRHYRSVAYSDKPGEFMMLFEDTTHQVELEKAYNLASKSMKTNNDLLTNMPLGFKRAKIICDENDQPIDFKILEVNQAYQKQTGIDITDYVGKTIKEVFPDVEQSWIKTMGEVALDGHSKHIIDYNHNTEKYFEVSAFCPKTGEFALFIKDVTGREKARIELENAYEEVSQSTKLNADLLKNLQEGFMHCELNFDADNKPMDFTILSVNDAFVEQTGIEKSSLVGRRIFEIFPDMKPEKFAKYCEVGMNGNSDNFIDYCDYTGKIFDISSFSPRLNEFIWIIRDITQKEKDRLELEKAYQKAEEGERLKTAFLANMSHEIRTPLNAILGFSELLQDKNMKQDDESKCLDNIKNSGKRLLTIVSDILEVSKLEAKQQKLNFTEHNLNRIVDRLHEQFQVIKIDDSLTISCHKPFKDSEAHIETDATRLEQILSNLLENALKHTTKGEVQFGYNLKGDFLEFFVKDNGSGIRQEDQKHIFKRFVQAKHENEINHGTGLGISIAEGYTQLFGGKMWLDSELGRGSTFYFTIPFIPVKLENEKPTVLVAEDEEANFLLLELWLKKYCNLIRAHDGHETVSQVEKNTNLDLVLMDIKMPYLNGVEATKEIRKSNKKIPIIAQTAFFMDDEKEEILDAGCNEIVSKPIKRDEFKKLLTNYIPHLKFA